MTQRQDRDAIYVKRQFDTEIIVVCVRWYITYRLRNITGPFHEDRYLARLSGR